MKADIILINKIEKDHLNDVKSKMNQLGSPVINAVWMDVWNAWVALEGGHRITAAIELNLPVIIEEIEYSENVEVREDLDIKDAPAYETVANFCDTAYMSADNMVEAEIIIK